MSEEKSENNNYRVSYNAFRGIFNVSKPSNYKSLIDEFQKKVKSADIIRDYKSDDNYTIIENVVDFSIYCVLNPDEKIVFSGTLDDKFFDEKSEIFITNFSRVFLYKTKNEFSVELKIVLFNSWIPSYLIDIIFPFFGQGIHALNREKIFSSLLNIRKQIPDYVHSMVTENGELKKKNEELEAFKTETKKYTDVIFTLSDIDDYRSVIEHQKQSLKDMLKKLIQQRKELENSLVAMEENL